MAVDQICIDNPGRVVAMEWHLRSGYPLYSPEASQKMRIYPPPQNNGYYTPWLWLDGRTRGSGYSGWANLVNERLQVPTEIGLVLGGSYDPGSRSGVAVAEFVNEGAEPLTATANVVITEDSVYYPSPNGDQWHNHVCRDFIPDQYGTVVTVPAGGADTLEMPYTLDASWDESRCKVLVFIQATDVQADSTRPVYQGGEVPVMALTGISGETPPGFGRGMAVTACPNPMSDRVEVRFGAAPGSRYKLDIYGADGRHVRSMNGVVPGHSAELTWNRTDGSGTRVARGVYGYRLSCDRAVASGKLVVTD